MFWLKRLKSVERDTHWSLPFGDLMSLLLAVFVMIAAMSELRAGSRYGSVAGGVRQAFGFSSPERPQAGGIPTTRPMSLLDRLEQVGLAEAGPLRLDPGAEDPGDAACQVVREADRLVLRFAGGMCFERYSGVLRPAADRVVGRLADHLAAGRGILEIHGYAGDGPIPENVPYRDAWDLSYQRARAAADVLIRHGVAGERLCLVAMGDRQASNESTDPSDRSIATMRPASGGASLEQCRLEIVVRSGLTDPRAGKIAEKEQVRDGQEGQGRSGSAAR
ncbi:MAG TPA: OmpA family protein [Phycisphaerae bacterium]|nr:OmpA family protein [Phycisphaerae bacterium]